MKKLSLLLESEDFLASNIADGTVTINEKIDASRIILETNHRGIRIMKRNGRLIEKADLILNHFFYPAYHHLMTMYNSGVIPENVRIGFDYLPEKDLNNINYARIPLNGLILTDVKEGRDQNYDSEYLWEWAKKLNVEPAPIIYQGKVSECEILKELIRIESLPIEERQSEYETKSLLQRIIEHTSGDITGSIIQENPDDPFEGIAVRIQNEDKNFVFQIQARNHQGTPNEKPSDAYTLAVNDMINYFEGRVLYKDFTSTNPDGRYVEIINDNFVDFMNEYKEKYRDTKELRPGYMCSKIWDVNVGEINHEDVVNVIGENSSFGELYKIMLASFRKKKIASYGLLSEEDILRFNSIVDKMLLISDGFKPDEGTFEDLH